MRLITPGLHAFRPFSRSWITLFLVALVCTFGLGGGTPNSAPLLVAEFFLIGQLLASLLVFSALQISSWLARQR